MLSKKILNYIYWPRFDLLSDAGALAKKRKKHMTEARSDLKMNSVVYSCVD